MGCSVAVGSASCGSQTTGAWASRAKHANGDNTDLVHEVLGVYVAPTEGKLEEGATGVHVHRLELTRLGRAEGGCGCACEQRKTHTHTLVAW